MATMTMTSPNTLTDSITPFRLPEVTTSVIAHTRPVERPNSTSFTVLPEEILVKFLEWCDFKGVLACRLTCRALRDVVTHSTSLRYKLALSEHGMCDGISNELSTAEKLELLTAHAAAWGSLDSVHPENVGMLVGWSAPIAISCNVIVFSKEEDGPEPRLDLLVLRVPSILRRVEAAHWVLALPAGAREICIDASQDLLIYVLGCAFHVRTLSTGAVYPLVEHEAFFKMWNGSRPFDVRNPYVCGDFVAAATRVHFISVWNWKTGELVFDQMSEVMFSSFDFLDEFHILYSVSKEDSLYIYDLRGRVVDRQQQQKETQTQANMEPVCFQLALPPINRATTSRYIQLRRNALPFRDIQPSSCEKTDSSCSTPPFHADPRERLIVLRVATSPVERGEEQFELHIPARAMLDHFDAKKQRLRGGDGDLTVPWDDWHGAVRSTPPRRLPYVIQAPMVAYGMRVLSYPPDWGLGMLHVDSYLPRTRRRGAGAGASANEEVETSVRAGSVTRQAIRLPGEVADKADLLSVLCEDALLFYKLDFVVGKISEAYWYIL